MASHLFSPIDLCSLRLANRIVVSPMCQYSAVDGCMTDWHLMHLGQLAVSGAGLLFVEATGVEPAGRITHGCTGLYSDENEAAMARVIAFCRAYGNARIGIQLGHAGRKASSAAPWLGGRALTADEGAWQTWSASDLPLDADRPAPQALDEAGRARVKAAFVQSAERALRLGFDVIELHSAHGYLLHQFLSPLSNRRSDAYGGSLEGRMRFPLEVFEAVRAVWPAARPLGVRLSATDWLEGGWDLESSIAYVAALQERGCDFVDVSSGGLSPDQKIAIGPGYQVKFAAEIRRATQATVMSVGQILEPQQAETIIASGQADMVALARGLLFDPRWPWHAAQALGESAAFPPQYQRAHASLKGDPTPRDLPTKR